jgi:hypothetical protein
MTQICNAVFYPGVSRHVTAFLRRNRTFNDIVMILVILYYEYALTFSMEVERFWPQRFSWASCFFYLNRYLSLLGHIPVTMEYFLQSLASSPSVSITFPSHRERLQND